MNPSRFILAGMLFLFPAISSAIDFDFIGSQIPKQSISKPGSEFKDYGDGTLVGLSGKMAARMLATPLGDSTLNTRGTQDIEIYRNASPSVVKIASDAGQNRVSFGSGIYIGSNKILTNAHVVGSNSTVLIAFKPAREGVKVNPSSVIVGRVLQTDRARDLALLSVSSVPNYVHPLALGDDSELQVGADVYAIGHPTGEDWTFTRGLISQIRKGYDWNDEEGRHRADVVQTQTPINVGNSGGPLIGASGKLLGVNSFKKSDMQGLNFAIAIGEVSRFLTAPSAQNSAQTPSCKGVLLYQGRNKENTANIKLVDTNCDQKADLLIIAPDDPTKPLRALFDTNYDGKFDVSVNDYNRDGLWDVSFYDTHFNGRVDLVGFHPDGQITASWYEKYDASKAYTQFRAKQKIGTLK